MDPELTQTLELLHRVQEGEAEALDRLFNRYYFRVEQVVKRRLGDKLAREVGLRDLLHEALIEALRGLGKLEVRDAPAFMGWLVAIVENRIRHFHRHGGAAKRDRAREVDLERIALGQSSGRIHLEPSAGITGPLERLVREEERRAFAEALESLEARHREVILLRNFERLPWKEVARALGLASVDAARMSHNRAKVALKRAMDRALD